MQKVIQIGSLFLLLILASCTSGKAQKSKDNKKYQEDLSSVRPKYEYKAETEKPAPMQEKSAVKIENDVTTKVNVRMDSVAAKNSRIKMAEGYRVLVYTGNSSAEATKVRERVYKVVPDAAIYPQYKQPTFRVKVGDCYDKLEAQNLYVKLRKEFPEAKIVPDQINIIAK
ncbi:MAG: SPOR domain-containing protein [Cytophagaceae bacterium]